MELKPGYKQTEIGVIPDDWEVIPLISCLSSTPNYGINASAVPYSDRLPAYIRITDISEDGQFLSHNPVSVKSINAAKYFLSDGDIVFARTGASVGKSYRYKLADGSLVFAGFLIRVHPDPTKLLPSFVAAYVTTGNYWRWVSLMSMRSGQPGINGKEYSLLPIPKPSLPEQRSIATALSDMDELLGGLDRLITKKRDLKQSAMQQLLTGKTRLLGFGEGKGYKQTEVGLIPEDWKLTSFDKFGDVIDGDRGINYPSGKDFNSDGYCLFLNAGNVTKSGFKFDECAFITCKKDESLNKGKLISHDIILTTRGTIGNFAYFDPKLPYKQMRINSGMVILRNQSSSIDTKFLYALFQSRCLGTQIDRMVFGSAQPQLTVKGISKFAIIIPPLPEQIAIASILSDMDTEIATLEQRRTKTRDLKQAMMQELLTGRIRLL